VLVVLLVTWSHLAVMLKYDFNGVTERALDFLMYVFFDPLFGVTGDLKEAMDRISRKSLQPILFLVAEALRSLRLALFKCWVLDVGHQGEFRKTFLGERNIKDDYRGQLSSRFGLMNFFVYLSHSERGSDLVKNMLSEALAKFDSILYLEK
jgi:hypothetical protein